MRKNKRVFIVISLLLCVSIFLICQKGSDNVTLDEVRLKDTALNKGMFAIMLEKEDDSDKYEQSDNNKFPVSGYLYNSNKSGCIDSNNNEVKNVLEYHSDTKKVSVKTNQVVYCYLYFSKDSALPDVTNFYIGEHRGEEYTNVNTNKKVHIEWNDEDVKDYCLTTTNSADDCNWKPITEISTIAANHTAETTADLGTDNKKYNYYVYLKDKADNVSTLDSESQDEIILDTEAPTITNLRQTANAETSVTVSLNVIDPIGTDESPGSGVDKVYFKIKQKNGGNYIGSEASENATANTVTHIFNSNLTAGTEYTVEVYATDKVTNDSSVTTLDVTTKALSKASDVLIQKQDTYLKNTGKGDLQYRYVGAQDQSSSINNYVCFGASSCSGEADNHLYRIIGITSGGQLKIQKNSSMKHCQWASNSNILWPNSAIYSYLIGNSFYANNSYVTAQIKTKIDTTHQWNTGDVTNYSSTATDGSYGTKIYDQEKKATNHKGAVGLAYLSDYYFASNDGGTQNYLSGNYCKSWMVPSNYSILWKNTSSEWTMTRYGNANAWNVNSNGNANISELVGATAIRPVFYLQSTVTISGGEGTVDNPYIIN